MSTIDWDLLSRHAAGECTPAERAHLERWLAESAEHRELLQAMREIATDGLVTAAAERRAAALASVKRARRPTLTMMVPRRQSPFLKWGAIAAVLAAVAAGVGSLALQGGPSDGTLQETVVRTLTTPRGQRASFQLPDGTHVILGAASTLRHAVPFTGETREVSVDGEAYFEVTHDERRPFIVRAGDLVAEDLGTEFVVRAYPEDDHAHVVVREGKVAIAGRIVAPGQLGRLNDAGQPIIEPADTSVYFGWTVGRLVFDDVPLRDALPQLGRWYDLDFRLADSSLADLRLAATLKHQQRVDALNVLALGLGIRSVRRGRVVTLYPVR